LSTFSTKLDPETHGFSVMDQYGETPRGQPRAKFDPGLLS